MASATVEDFKTMNLIVATFGCAVVVYLVFSIMRALYNISPLHPLAKYPGPPFWRAFQLPSAYRWAMGDIYPYIVAIHEKYGPVVRIAPDELLYATPDAWQPIYNSRPQLQKMDALLGGASDVEDLPQSMILMASDSEHLRLRRLMNPAFLNSGITKMEPNIQHHADLLCSQLAKAAREEGAQNLVEWFIWTLTDLTGCLTLGTKFECLQQREMHPWPGFLLRVLQQAAKMNFCCRYGLQFWMIRPFIPKKLRQQEDDFMSSAKVYVDQVLLSMDGDDTNIPRLVTQNTKEGDCLSRSELLSNSLMLVGAGIETTSTALSLTTYFLCTFPRVMTKLKDEIRGSFASYEDITLAAVQELKYLKATLEETWRIFPQTGVIPRRVTPAGGHVINGEWVPGGTYVAVAQVFMGQSEKFFDNPKDYRPERWLYREVQEASGLRPDEIIKPFSLGPRNCIGKLLAYAEARVILAKLIWKFDLELEGSHASWTTEGRIYVAWDLSPLMVRLKQVQ